MQNIKTAVELKLAIKELEDKLANERPVLKKEFLAAYERLKLINVIKSTLKEAVAAPDLKANIINTAIGLGTGFIAKKTIIGKTSNPFKKLLGIILELTVANKIAHNAAAIKKVGGIVLNKITQSENGSATN
jgi:hypothetical protein